MGSAYCHHELGSEHLKSCVDESSMNFVIYGSVFAAVILSIVLVVAFMKNESDKDASHQRDFDIEEVVEAEIVE